MGNRHWPEDALTRVEELEQECRDRDETEQSLVAWNEKLHTQKEAWLAAAMALQELVEWDDPHIVRHECGTDIDDARKLLDIAASLER